MIVIANGQRVDAAKLLAAPYKRAPGQPGTLSIEEAQFALDAANETRRNNRQDVGVLAFGWNTFRGRMLQVYANKDGTVDGRRFDVAAGPGKFAEALAEALAS